MNSAVDRVRPLAEPLVAVVYLLSWLVANWPGAIVTPVARGDTTSRGAFSAELLIALGIGISVTLCRKIPMASLIVICTVITLQLLAPPARFGPLGWGAYLMLAIIAFGLGQSARGRLRWIVPLALAGCAVAITALLVLPRFSATGIVGLLSGAHASTLALLPQVAGWSLVWIAIVLGPWFGGYWIQRSSRSRPIASADAIDRVLGTFANRLVRVRPAIEPAVGVAFYGLWINAEAGRIGAAPWPLFPVTLALVAGSIALSRVLPRVAMSLGGVLFLVQLFVISARFSSTSWPVYLGLLLSCLVVSANAVGRIRWISLPLTIGYAVLATVLMDVPGLSDGYGWTSWAGEGVSISHVIAGGFSIFGASLILTVTAWFIGFGMRAWRMQRAADAKLDEAVEELHSAEIDLIIASERDRIAQDVHDIMAHSLSVIIAQADGARFIGPRRPEAVNQSLERIAGSARTSLREVRMLIESLVADPDGHSNPTLDDLDALTERMRMAGLDITVDRFGVASALTSTQELAVYRIVQESLTNALKHSGDRATARITLDWRGPGLALTVVSHGNVRVRTHNGSAMPTSGLDSHPGGRGLYGMRERARLAGGWLTSGEDDETDGGYLVTAFIPGKAATDAPEPAAVAVAQFDAHATEERPNGTRQAEDS